MSEPVKLIALLKARPGTTREEFADRWLNDHAAFTLRFANLKGYPINIPLEEMHEDFASPEAEIAVADAKAFTSVLTHIYTREHVLR
jgi:hypothetical protein